MKILKTIFKCAIKPKNLSHFVVKTFLEEYFFYWKYFPQNNIALVAQMWNVGENGIIK